MKETESIIFGVCKTLEKETGVNAWVYRAFFIGLSILGGSGVLVYVILALII